MLEVVKGLGVLVNISDIDNRFFVSNCMGSNGIIYMGPHVELRGAIVPLCSKLEEGGIHRMPNS